MNISALIITFNEERNIERCIRSLEGVADEIIVVDSFSSDRTAEICLGLNVAFIQHPFEGHIQQKNYAMSCAKFPFVLSLDADEALSDTLRTSIFQIKKEGKAEAYYFNRKTNYCGKWLNHCWYPDAKVRLWKKDIGQWGGVNPHDIVILNEGIKPQWIKGDLLHYSYYSVSQHLRQLDKFTEIAVNELRKTGKPGNSIKLFGGPVWKFFNDYFFKLGFLDGFHGFVVCAISSFATFIKYTKLRINNK